MKIYFQNITFQGSPLVWELNESTHQATCLLYCIKKGTHSRFEPKISLDMFHEYPGVTIDDGAIIVKDVRTFPVAYQTLEHLNELKDKIVRSKPPIYKKQSTFFQYKKDNALESSTSYSKAQADKRRRSSSMADLPLYGRISLDDLIKKDDHANSSLWGDTVAYETYFEEKTRSDAKARGAIFLKSVSSFYIMVQYEKNHHLYPLKSQLIKEIRKLLDSLDPIYVNWCAQEITSNRKSIFLYFQNAVLEAMINGTFNDKPTEFDTPELEKSNPKLKQYAIEKARALRAELMLMKFNILINPELFPELALNEKEAKKVLPEITSFRQFVLKQPIEVIEDIKLKLKDVAGLIIQSGIVEESNLKLSTQLNHELSTNAAVIMDFHSFQALLHLQLDKQLSSNKKELIPDIATKVAKETIIQINKTFGKSHGQYIAQLSNIVDSDFYLCKEWAEQLAVELEEIILKHPKEEKKVLAYSHAIADKVVTFLQTQLHDYTPTLNEGTTASISM